MFEFLKGKGASPPAGGTSMRDTLFGDRPMSDWPVEGGGADGEVWDLFVRARRAAGEGRMGEAVAAWRGIVGMPGLESRHYLQAWHFLRSSGVQPPAEQAKRLLGVVLEVPVNGGLDLLAAYPEHHARYFNFSGAAIIWDHPDDSADPYIDALLSAGQAVLDVVGPWEHPRPPAPAEQVRMNFLSPAGLHFGQAPMNVLMEDPMARPVINAGVILMQHLMSRQKR